MNPLESHAQDLTRRAFLGRSTAGLGALALGSFVAGVVNSVAGGGSLVTFPIALAAGLSPLAANATNSVALLPGSVTAAYGFRRELERDGPVVRALLPVTLFGSACGCALQCGWQYDGCRRGDRAVGAHLPENLSRWCAHL
jgi:hypothetical protein